MIHFALVHTSGRITQTGTAESAFDLHALVGPDVTPIVVEADVSDVTHWYDHGSGMIEAYPPRPGDWARFDFVQRVWIDPRTADDLAAELSAARGRAIAQVNGWAAQERAKHITAIPGQDMIYLAKEAEAIRWLGADPAPTDPADFPLIAAEIGITAETSDQLAQLWVNLGHLWRGLAAQIETARLGTIKAITEAGDQDGIAAALAGLPGIR